MLALVLTAAALLPCLASAACCGEAEACQRMVAEARSGCEAAMAPACKLLSQIVDERPSLRTFELGNLPLDQKDLAGTYQFFPHAMRVMNEWKVGDAPGIRSNGRAELSVSSLCMSPQDIRITARAMWYSVSIRIESRPMERQQGERVLRVHPVELGGRQYLFVWP